MSNPESTTLHDDSYAHVLSVEHVDAALPFEVTPGYAIARADSAQIDELRRDLPSFFPPFSPGRMTHPSPYETKRTVFGEGGGWSWAPRKPEECAYIVINFSGYNHKVELISNAGSLLPGTAEVEIGLTYITTKGAPPGALLPDAPARSPIFSTLDLHRFFHMYATPSGGPAPGLSRLSQADVERLAKLCRQIEAHDEKIVELRPKLHALHALRSFGALSGLALVGYMTIVESLLTHKPQPLDIHDSLTKQVVNKMTLLEHRVPGGFGYQNWFPGKLSGEHIWKRLYGIRSAIAHGDHPEYKKGEIQDYQTALKFLREVVKSLIRQALDEPQLIRDLHNC